MAEFKYFSQPEDEMCFENLNSYFQVTNLALRIELMIEYFILTFADYAPVHKHRNKAQSWLLPKIILMW